MLEQATDVFDNLDGKFLARLREISSNTRTTTATTCNLIWNLDNRRYIRRIYDILFIVEEGM